MKTQKKVKAEAAGWRVGNAEDFLELSPEEAAFVDLKLALADYVKRLRTKAGLTQTDVARRLKSSQSRIAKMEAADPTVSLDLLVRSVLALGASRSELAKVMGSHAA
jgi:ribosome-binding protein aMBF1 (putative translation factor)